MLNLALPVFAYLFGSISSAIIVSKIMALPDPRNSGSNNPGATNVLRLGGKKAAAIALAGDILKGLIPVVVAKALTTDPMIIALVAGAAFLGHLYPIFFGFKGGKGVATAAGVFLGLNWAIALGLFVVWLIIAVAFRFSSLAALIAAASAPLFTLWLNPQIPYLFMATVVSLLLIWRHRKNISRLLSGEESKIGG